MVSTHPKKLLLKRIPKNTNEPNKLSIFFTKEKTKMLFWHISMDVVRSTDALLKVISQKSYFIIKKNRTQVLHKCGECDTSMIL